MKKNLFFAALAASAVLAGCSKNEVFDLPSPDSLDNMEFATVIGKQTKAEESTTQTLKDQGPLQMFNYAAEGTDFASATSMTQFFNAQPENLTHVAGRGWVTSDAYKWSTLGTKMLNIYTIHPSLAQASDFTEPTATDAAKFNYTVAATPAEQKDLIVSAALNLTQVSTAGKINLKFKHILSQVVFKVKTDNSNFRVKIKKLEVVGAKNGATFTFLKTVPTQQAPAIGAWSALTGSADYKFVDGSNAIYGYNSNVAQEVMGDGGALMLMPQPIDDNFKFKIIYDVVDDVFDDIIITANIEKEAAMVAMEMGKKYSYTLILPNQDADQIRFSVEVDEWDPAVIEHERKFEVLTLNKAKIEENIKNYATRMVTDNKNSYIHTVQVNGAMSAAMEIDLSTLAGVKKGTQIVLDFTNVTALDTHNLTVKIPSSGWSASTASLTAAGKITLTKN